MIKYSNTGVRMSVSRFVGGGISSGVGSDESEKFEIGNNG